MHFQVVYAVQQVPAATKEILSKINKGQGASGCYCTKLVRTSHSSSSWQKKEPTRFFRDTQEESAFVSYCYITHNYQLSGLEQHKFIILQCWRPEVQK